MPTKKTIWCAKDGREFEDEAVAIWYESAMEQPFEASPLAWNQVPLPEPTKIDVGDRRVLMCLDTDEEWRRWQIASVGSRSRQWRLSVDGDCDSEDLEDVVLWAWLPDECKRAKSPYQRTAEGLLELVETAAAHGGVVYDEFVRGTFHDQEDLRFQPGDLLAWGLGYTESNGTWVFDTGRLEQMAGTPWDEEEL